MWMCWLSLAVQLAANQKLTCKNNNTFLTNYHLLSLCLGPTNVFLCHLPTPNAPLSMGKPYLALTERAHAAYIIDGYISNRGARPECSKMLPPLAANDSRTTAMDLFSCHDTKGCFIFHAYIYILFLKNVNTKYPKLSFL